MGYCTVLIRRTPCAPGPVSSNPCRSQVSVHRFKHFSLRRVTDSEFLFRVRKDTEHHADCKGACVASVGPDGGKC